MRIIKLLIGVLVFNVMAGMAQVAQFNNATDVVQQQPLSPVIGYEPGRNLAVQPPAGQVTTAVDAKQLQQWAETLKLGYKTANLMQLSKLLKRERGKLPGGYQVQVPEFYGISATQTSNVLSKQGLVLEREWRGIVERTVTKAAYEKHVVTPEFVKACEGLANAIEVKFNKAADVIAAQEQAQQNPSLWGWLKQSVWESESPLVAAGFDSATAKGIMALVKDVAKAKGFVTLRSTGLREDTTTIANAGGNESREIVKANLAETMRAMGAVASSYIRSKSLLQRSGKDEKIHEVPDLPVLLQRVVGEHEGSPVVSCVAYSQERQGNTEGVSVAQCAYGHGKTVVDSLFPVDTYYVDDKTGVQRTVIRLKTKRMAPRIGRTSFGLEEVDVEAPQQQEAALDSTAQQAIHAIMINLEHAYGQPMDVELVADPAKKVVYLVQARPIVYEAQQVQPMYIADAVKFDKAQMVRCNKIYETGAVYDLKPAAVLVADDLEGALKTVLSNEDKKQPDPQVIVVKEPGAITSHAGATLAGKGIVLLQVDDLQQLNGMLANKDAQLVVDTQRGLIADVTQDSRFAGKDAAALTKFGMLVAGRYSHPIPAVMSVPTSGMRADISTQLAQYAQLKDAMPNQSVQELLTMLKEAPQAQAHEALATLLGRVAKEINDLSQQQACKDVEAVCRESADQDVCKIQALLKGTCFKEKTAAEAKDKMRAVFNAMLEVAGQVDQKLALPSRSLNRLLMVNFLEALMLQETSTSVVNAYSVENIKAAFAKEVDFINKKLAPMMKKKVVSGVLLANRPLLLLAQKGVDAAPTAPSEETWATLVSTLGTTLKPAALREFEVAVNTIDALGALPTWIYARVAPAAAKEPNAVKVSESLLKEVAASKPIITKLQGIKQRLAAVDYGRWQEPKSFEANVKHLKAQLLDTVESKEFLTIFAEDTGQPFARMVAVPVMHELVESLDKVIKTLKASTLYSSDAAKVKDLKTLIKLDAELLDRWAHEIPDGVLTYNPNWPLDNYLAQLKDILRRLPESAEQLLPSTGFDVRAAALGSAVAFHRHYPVTLEDAFTTIHQSLEVTMGAFAQELVASIELPPLAQRADTILRAQRAQVTGVTIASGKVTLFYNLPLLNHSAAFALSWSKERPGVDLTYKFYGEARARWGKILAMGTLMGAAYDSTIKDVQFSSLGLSFTQYLQDGDMLAHAQEMIPRLIAESAGGSSGLSDENQPYVKDLANKLAGKGDVQVVRAMLLLNEFTDEEVAAVCGDTIKELKNLVDLSKDQDSAVRRVALSLLSGYANNPVYEAEVFKVAIEAFKDSDSSIRDEALYLLKWYANNPVYEDKVFKVAVEAFNSQRSFEVYRLLRVYVDKPTYEAEVFKMAAEVAKNEDYSDCREALVLLRGYASKVAYEDKVFKVAVEAFDRHGRFVYMEVYRLLRAYADKPTYEDKVFKLAVEAFKGQASGVRELGVQLVGIYADKPTYEDRVFKVVVEVLGNKKNIANALEASRLLRVFAANPTYEAEVFNIAEGELKEQEGSSFITEAIDTLYLYVNKAEYTERLLKLAAANGVKNDPGNTAKWQHLQVLILWSKLTWYQKAYWKTKYLLGATDEEFIKAQLP